MPGREVVIARYAEDVRWARDLPARVTVYNKGPDALPGAMPLPNVGLADHTFLHHILTRYDTLADFTVFTQGRWDDHVPKNFHLRTLLEWAEDLCGAVLLTKMREWGPDGRLVHHGKWADDLAAGRLARARLSLVDYFQTYLGVDLEYAGHLNYFPGSIFGASARLIRKRPRRHYERLLETVSHHAQPEEAHYLERSWVYQLASGKTKTRVACIVKPEDVPAPCQCGGNAETTGSPTGRGLTGERCRNRHQSGH